MISHLTFKVKCFFINLSVFLFIRLPFSPEKADFLLPGGFYTISPLSNKSKNTNNIPPLRINRREGIFLFWSYFHMKTHGRVCYFVFFYRPLFLLGHYSLGLRKSLHLCVPMNLVTDFNSFTGCGEFNRLK